MKQRGVRTYLSNSLWGQFCNWNKLTWRILAYTNIVMIDGNSISKNVCLLRHIFLKLFCNSNSAEVGLQDFDNSDLARTRHLIVMFSDPLHHGFQLKVHSLYRTVLKFILRPNCESGFYLFKVKLVVWLNLQCKVLGTEGKASMYQTPIGCNGT